MKEIIDYIEEQIKKADNNVSNCEAGGYSHSRWKGYIIAMENVLREIIARGVIGKEGPRIKTEAERKRKKRSTDRRRARNTYPWEGGNMR